ncbi:7 transmembrane receptor (rhodopsin family) domain-containing protein [Ditylenchus destructor]|nr:7 transmembrane receptor (rhodopsin family) domain-containing protein [Ditylenchus destructor]
MLLLTTPSSFEAPAPPVATIERQTADTVEIIYLSVIILVGTTLNLIVFIQLTRQSKTPTASTSFLTGPYHMSSFCLFKVNLSLTDFAILLFHALGKVIWLTTYEWKFGDTGCKLYQFLSAFAYYSNSNVIVAIGLDRLKVVYTSHLQGAASVRRVRILLIGAWIMAIFCALPQLFFWTSIELSEGWHQCTTIWEISKHYNTTTELQQRMQILYEMLHQSIVFWIPFFTLFISYLLIIVKVLRYTFIHSPVIQCNGHSSPSLRPKRSKIDLRMFRWQSRDQTQLFELSTDTMIQNEFSTSSISEEATPKKKMSAISGIVAALTCPIRVIPPHRSLSTAAIRPQRKDTVRSSCLSTDSRMSQTKERVCYRKTGCPLWRRQLRSKVFITSLIIVVTHCAFWLPYNLLNSARFINADFYTWIVDNGGLLLEDLIILNSLVNPILYGYESR